jgi:hypothetical protein
MSLKSAHSASSGINLQKMFKSLNLVSHIYVVAVAVVVVVVVVVVVAVAVA